jgi:hypothetical protein
LLWDLSALNWLLWQLRRSDIFVENVTSKFSSELRRSGIAGALEAYVAPTELERVSALAIPTNMPLLRSYRLAAGARSDSGGFVPKRRKRRTSGLDGSAGGYRQAGGTWV